MTFLDKLFGRNKKKTGRVLSDFDKNYFTGKELGKGAFGIDLVMIAVVKEVVRKSDSKKFAAKIIDKSRVKNEMDSIHTEIDVLKKLQHPNIVKLVDLYQTNDHFYLVMDLATGGELFERILARGNYTEKDAAHLVAQLLTALVYLHDQVNIVHRDLKPENLIFRDPLETSDLLITDFGLSKLVGGNEFLSTTCGTPHYVAPEVLKESGHGKPVDMWAIGVITYVLLCGYTPFWGGETNSTPILYQAIIKGQYEFEEEYWGMVSDQDFISKLLLVNPDKRMIAKEALEHPWMATTQTVDLLPNVRKNFNAKMTLKKAILAVAALNKVSSMSKSNLQQ